MTSGDTPFLTIPRILIGSVMLSGPVVKKLTTTSSSDIVSASMAPDKTPGRIIGSVTLRKILQSFAPRSLAASSTEGSKPASLDRTVITTKGMENVT